MFVSSFPATPGRGNVQARQSVASKALRKVQMGHSTVESSGGGDDDDDGAAAAPATAGDIGYVQARQSVASKALRKVQMGHSTVETDGGGGGGGGRTSFCNFSFFWFF